MDNEKIINDGFWIVEETTALSRLVIAEGARVAARDGKTLTLTIDGVGAQILPGVYEGDIVLTVADAIPVSFIFNPEPYNFRVGICLENGRYVAEKSVPSIINGGKIDGATVEGITITGNDECFNGIFSTGEGEFTVNDVKMDFSGPGGNDFIGYGAALMSFGNTKMTVNNADIKTRGVVRGAVFVGGNSTMIVNNSKISSMDGIQPAEYEDNIIPGQMRAVPWMLGLRGNCRTTNLADYGTVYYNNCHIISERWGVLSTDSVDECRMHVKDSLIEITGSSGYGTYVEDGSFNVFDGCTINVPDYAVIVSANKAGATLTNSTVVNSGRFGIMCNHNVGGEITVDKGSALNTGRACFLIKGCAPVLNLDGARLCPQNGVIVQLFDNDDPQNPKYWYSDPQEDDTPNPERDLTIASGPKAMAVNFSNMEVTGDLYNSTTNIERDPAEMPHMDMPMPVFGPDGPPEGFAPPEMLEDAEKAKNMAVKLSNTRITGIITASKAVHRAGRINKANCEELGEVINTTREAINNGVIVSLDAQSAWTVTGTSYLTALNIAEGAAVTAAEGKTVSMTVDGKPAELVPGCFTGKIVITVQ